MGLILTPLAMPGLWPSEAKGGQEKLAFVYKHVQKPRSQNKHLHVHAVVDIHHNLKHTTVHFSFFCPTVSAAVL